MAVLLLALMLVPIANAFTIDGPINFESANGGIVRFDDSTVSLRYNIYNTLSQFGSLRYNAGPNRGTLAFDCQAGVNMTILGVSNFIVTYNVSTLNPGAVTSYVYYRNHNTVPPVGTNTDNLVFNALTDITTVTTTGNGVIVTLDYTNLQLISVEESINIMIDFFPIVVFVFAMMIIELGKMDYVSNNVVIYALVVAVAAIILGMYQAIGA